VTFRHNPIVPSSFVLVSSLVLVLVFSPCPIHSCRARLCSLVLSPSVPYLSPGPSPPVPNLLVPMPNPCPRQTDRRNELIYKIVLNMTRILILIIWCGTKGDHFSFKWEIFCSNHFYHIHLCLRRLSSKKEG
jgi:hypothetical protein